MRYLFIFSFLLCILSSSAQYSNPPLIHTEQINIARDSFGVPHIFAPTDAEVAYGLAWAHAEDDFATMQMLILTGKGKVATWRQNYPVLSKAAEPLLNRESMQQTWALPV